MTSRRWFFVRALLFVVAFEAAVAACLALVGSRRAAGIDVSEWPVPAGDDAPVPEQAVHDTTIAVVTAVGGIMRGGAKTRIRDALKAAEL